MCLSGTLPNSQFDFTVLAAVVGLNYFLSTVDDFRGAGTVSEWDHVRIHVQEIWEVSDSVYLEFSQTASLILLYWLQLSD